MPDIVVELPDGTEAEFPEGTSEDTMRQALAKYRNPSAPQKHEAPKEEESALHRFVSGAAQNLLPSTTAADYIQGPLYALQHPLDSAQLIGESVLGAHKAEASKAAENFKQGRYSEAAGHGLAAAIPLVGPAAAHAGETIASGDIAGGAGQAFGLLAPIAAKPALKVAAKSVPESVPAALEKGATERITDVIAPKVGKGKNRFGGKAEKVALKLAQEPDLGAFSREGLQEKVRGKFTDAKAELDAANDARNEHAAIDPAPIRQKMALKLQDRVAKAVEGSRTEPERPRMNSHPTGGLGEPEAVPIGEDVVPKNFQAGHRVLSDAIKELDQLGPVVHYDALKKLRQSHDVGAEKIYTPSVVDDFLTPRGEGLAHADAAGAIRDALSEADPDTAVANARYSLLKNATDVLQAAHETERSRPNRLGQIATRTMAMILGHHAAGLPGEIAGLTIAPAIEHATSGFTTKIYTARAMAKLAEALRSGDLDTAEGLLHVLETAGSASARAGRTQSAAQQQ